MQETTDTAISNTPPAPRTDRLELVKELGRGSIGVVHKAKNPQQGRVSALRQFEVPQWLDDVNELLNRILAEARAASALDHPNIARLYTCGYKGYTIFMTSDFVEGQSLKEILSTRQPEMAEVLSWSKQLLSALDFAHDKNVYHHFLNPANIKVLPDGTLKVLDFGLLKDKHLLSQTPAKKLENEPYLSPEEVKNKPPDRSANLFSAATIIYQLYTCRNPFAGKHLGEVDRAIMDVTPHPLNMAHPRVPPAISTVVLKALSKNRTERFPNGREMFVALEEAVKAVPLAPPPAPKPVAAPKPAAPEPENLNGAGIVAISAPPPAASRTQVLPPAPATARVQVGTTNHWKLAGAVATCLVVVAALAYLFQRKPAENTIESSDIEAAKPAPRMPAPTPAATPVVAPDATTPVSEPVVEVTQPEPAPATRVISSVRRSRPVRVSRAANAPAAAAPQEGELEISSFPADATIEIDRLAGQSWKTPQTLTGFPAGSYKVTISKPGYASDMRTVQITAGGHMAMDVRLTVVKGWLTVGGSPAGASVLVDGQDTGKVTPVTLMLDPASHNVMLRKNGYLEAGSAVQLVAGQTVSYSPSLMVAGRTDNIKIVGGGIGKVFDRGGSQGRARIEIKTEPKGAQVVINGTPLQKTTPVEIQVEAGNYDIILQKDGYKDLHENTIVGIEDRIKINRTLSR
jgi:serine/threonine-protein kinase